MRAMTLSQMEVSDSVSTYSLALTVLRGVLLRRRSYLVLLTRVELFITTIYCELGHSFKQDRSAIPMYDSIPFDSDVLSMTVFVGDAPNIQ